MDKKQKLSEDQLDQVSGGGDFDFDAPLVIPGMNDRKPAPQPFDPFESEYNGIPDDEGTPAW